MEEFSDDFEASFDVDGDGSASKEADADELLDAVWGGEEKATEEPAAAAGAPAPAPEDADKNAKMMAALMQFDDNRQAKLDAEREKGEAARKKRAVNAAKAKEDEGKLAADAGDWEKAVEAYQAAVELVPDDERLQAALDAAYPHRFQLVS